MHRLEEAGTYVNGRLEEPLASRLGVGDGLLGGESLGGDDEEGRLGVALGGDFGDVGAVDVGDKVHLEVLGSVRLEGLGDHHGSEIRSSDSDVNDGVDALASVSLPLARADLVGELSHVVQYALHLVGASLGDLELAADVPQGDVKDSAVLGGVDVLASEHLVAGFLDVGLLGELQQRSDNLIVDQVLRQIGEDVDVLGGVVVALGELAEALGIGGEEVLEHERLVLGVVQLLELGPRRVICIDEGKRRASVSCSACFWHL